MISTSVLEIVDIDENSELNSLIDDISIDEDYASCYANTFQEWS